METMTYYQSDYSLHPSSYRTPPTYPTILNSQSRRGYNVPHDYSSTKVPMRYFGDDFDIGNRRDGIIDANSTVMTEHITTTIATLDLQGDPDNERWYKRDNYHTSSGNEYSTGGGRNRRHPSVYTQDVEIISIEVEAAGHDDYYNDEGFEDDYEYCQDHCEVTVYNDHDTIEYVVEETETVHDYEDTTEVVIELELEESLEYDHEDVQYQHGDDGTYANDQLVEAYDDSVAVYDTQQGILSLGYDHDDAVELSALADLVYEDESGFDLTGNGEGYDGDGDGFADAEGGDQDYGDDGGHDYQGGENDFHCFDDGGQDYGDEYADDGDADYDYGDDDYD